MLCCVFTCAPGELLSISRAYILKPVVEKCPILYIFMQPFSAHSFQNEFKGNGNIFHGLEIWDILSN